ncbi:MAG TPA: flagellar hook-basal body complex protein [Dongiaceae bacterium]|jgi:flagellar hook protein FlgE|nr:flagellar hook-basal body complex protein [Dongiaceae bacterium]
MSVLGALFTAVSGINAQSQAIGDISDNIANSQTTGYKKVGTRFENLLTVATSSIYQPGGVLAAPTYANNVQGNITQTQEASNAAISGNGFFVVRKPVQETAQGTSFTSLPYYTRAGDFTLNRSGYLVNSGNYYLDGWRVDATTGLPDTASLSPLKVTQLIDQPTATSSITFAGNLPASSKVNPTPPLGPSNIQVYDSLGNPHTVKLVWAKRADNIWKLDIQAPDSTLSPVAGTNIGVNDQTAAYANVTPNVAAVAQVDRATLPAWLPPGRSLSFTIGGNSISVTAPNTGYSGPQAASALLAAINGNPALAAAVTASNINGSQFDIASDIPGTSFAASLGGTGTGQLDSLTLPALATNADTLTYTIGANTVSVAGPLSAAQATSALAAAINGDPGLAGNVTAYADPVNTAILRIQANAAFGAFTGTVAGTQAGAVTSTSSAPAQVNVNTSNVPAVAQVDSVTLGGTTGPGEIGDVYTITVGTQSIAYVADGTETSLSDLANRFATQINANPGLGVTASAAGNALNLTSSTPGTPFSGSAAAANGSAPGFIDVRFGTSAATAGKIVQISNQFNLAGNAVIPLAQTAGQAATVNFTLDFGAGLQNVSLDLGHFQQADGVTQFAGTDIDATALTQDGLPQGNFRDLNIRNNGDVVLNYDNGRSRVFFRVPLAQFYDPNALQREDSQAFTETFDSGASRLSDPGANGAGTLSASAIEGSNVDIAEEFTKMIVTQRAYTANTRVITTADQMLSDILQIRQ